MALLELEDPAAAESELRESISLSPQLAKARVELAILLRKQGKSAEARDHLERAIASRPDLADAYYELGAAWADDEHQDLASEYFEKAP